MVEETRDPTRTTTIVAGFQNPQNAFHKDGVYASVNTAGAEQEYYGFAFDLPPDYKISKVVMIVKGFSASLTGFSYYYPKIWNKSKNEWYYASQQLTTEDKVYEFDYSDVGWTADDINNIKVRLATLDVDSSLLPAYFDWVAVKVEYYPPTTEVIEEQMEQAIQKGAEWLQTYWYIPLAIILAIVFAIILGLW